MFNNNDLLLESDKLKKFAYKLSSSTHDAEDLLHNTLVRAIEKKHLFQEDTNLFSWTSKIMYNLFVSAYRRKTKFETQYDPETFIEKESVEATQNIKMELDDVDQAMQKLPENSQEILMMVCVQGMAYAEVSEKLSIPIGTVRSRLSRARSGLQSLLNAPTNGFSPTHQNDNGPGYTIAA